MVAQIFTKNTTLDIVTAAEVTGSSWVDYDNDGDLDVIVYANQPSGNNPNGYHYIFRNDCGTGFTRITSGLGGGIEQDNGSGWADLDSDGDIDLYIPNHAIYYNNGSGTFTKVTSSPIIDAAFANNARPSFGDVDNDGDLDIMITTLFSPPQTTFFRNDGNGNYTNIQGGDVTNSGTRGTISTWGDYDNDGLMDIFVSVIPNPPVNSHKLYKNAGNGTFTEQTTSVIQTTPGGGYGGTWVDYDNDNDLDLYVPNSFPANFKLFNNDGSGNFTDASIAAGLTLSRSNNDGHAWGDIDNDGDLDLFQSAFLQNILYLNNGDGTFTLNTSEIVTNDVLVESYGASMVDFDNDGDLDLFVATNSGPTESLFYTNNGNSNNWVNIRCKGAQTNAAAVGARVYVKATIGGTPKWQFREMNGNPSAYQHNNNVANEHFGLGDAAIIDSIKVVWPTSGTVQYFTNVSHNRYIDITEGVNSLSNSKDCNVIPGSSCESAIDLGQGDSCLNNITMTGSEMWFKFVSEENTVRISQTVISGSLNSVVVFGGACNGLVVIDSVFDNSGTLVLDKVGFIIGQNYFIRTNGTNSTQFDLCLQNFDISNEKQIVVSHFPSITNESARDILTSIGGHIVFPAPYFRMITLYVDPMLINTISQLPWVESVDLLDHPVALGNNDSRSSINADQVLKAPFSTIPNPYNLSGLNVNIGIWDDGAVDVSSNDFAGRLTMMEPINCSPLSTHATHVAGTMAGSGINSVLHTPPGFPYQWCGMAPEANIFSWSIGTYDPSQGGCQNAPWPTDEMLSGVNNQNIVISQNAWNYNACRDAFPCDCDCNYFGAYDPWARNVDKLVSANDLSIIFSAGNYRGSGEDNCCGLTANNGGYKSMTSPATAKNIIAVGAIDKLDQMTSFSSWGPTTDGRLKPDVVAVGKDVLSTYYPVQSLPLYYLKLDGTSMSAPAVSGAVALLIERFQSPPLGITPKPALLKSILLNTAIDLENIGPDFKTGYGKIDVLRAIEIIDQGNYLTNTIANLGVNNQTINLPTTYTQVKIMLVYSDKEVFNLAGSPLINNLDIELIDPLGNTHLPLTLDPLNPANVAVEAVNTKDNVEQVVLNNPICGIWTIRVKGTNVPDGPQEYSITWDLIDPVFPLNSFIYSPANPCISIPVQFNDQLCSATSWFWDFGDGNTSTLQHPTHIYSSPGSYIVSFTAGVNTTTQAVNIASDCCAFGSLITYDDVAAPSDIPFGTTLFWDTQYKRINKTITVRANATLIIPASFTLEFGPFGKIVVEQAVPPLPGIPGGELILGGKLTSISNSFSACPVMWQGIEVLGISTNGSSKAAGQGKITLLAGSAIENAHIGVLLGKLSGCISTPLIKCPFWDLNAGGGIIDADGATFSNNGTAIQFVYYDKSNSSKIKNSVLTGGILLDPGYKSNNSYTYPNSANPHFAKAVNLTGIAPRLAYLLGVRNVTFQDNAFQTADIGIQEYNSRSLIIGTTSVGNLFSNLESFALVAHYYSSSNILFGNLIDGNTFNNPGPLLYSSSPRTIWIEGGKGDKIQNNIFGNQFFPPAQQNNSFGIYMYNSSAYSILDNDFYRNLNAITLYTGTFPNTSPASLIGNIQGGKGNNFTRCKRALNVLLDESPVLVRCNTTDNTDLNDYNFSNGATNWAIGVSLGQQGKFSLNNRTKPAGNRFDLTAQAERQIQGNPGSLLYYGHSSPDEFRPIDPSGILTPSIDNNSISCPIFADCCPIDPCLGNNPPLSCFTNSGRIADINQVVSDFQQEFISTFVNLDKNQTAQLLAAINGNTPNGKLKKILLENSFLSDEVLTAFINLNSTPPGHFKEVLIPNSPVSEEISSLLNAKLQTLPIGIASQIRKAQTSVDFRTLTAIARDIASANNQRSIIVNEQIAFLVDNDSLDQAALFLEQENSVSADQTLLATYIASNDLVAAQQKIASMSSSNLDQQSYIDLQDVLLNLALQGKSIHEMDVNQEAVVRNISGLIPRNLAASNACAILNLVFGETCPFSEQIIRKQNEIVQFSRMEQSTQFLGENIPNPFTHTTSIPYILPKGVLNGYINIYDITGKQIKRLEVNHTDNALLISANEFENGVYIYKLESRGEILGSKKMIIIK